MFKKIVVISTALVVCGCSEQILSKEETRVIGPNAATSLSVAPKDPDKTLLGSASTLADDLASAYFAAGVKAARAQDVINIGVYIAAASVAIGALGDASDRALTNRAVAGVGLQSIGQNGLKQSEIQSLFTGAEQLNCIAGVASIYSGSASKIADSSIAQNLAYAAMQEVRIKARSALVRDVGTFANVLKSFTDVIQGEPGDPEPLVADGAPIADLNMFATKLGTCISSS